MSIGQRFPGVAGLGFAGYIPGPRLVDLQLEWRQAGYGQLDVRPVMGGVWGLEAWHEAVKKMHSGAIV